MGIDISFTEKSLMASKFALCRKHRTSVVGVYIKIPETGNDPWLKYRKKNKILTREAAQKISVDVADQLFKEAFRSETNTMFFDELSPATRRLLEPVAEYRATTYIPFKGLTSQRVNKALLEAGEDHRESYWYGELTYEQRIKICSKCPICMENERNCYVRFSNYQSIAGFKAGFNLTLSYMFSSEFNEKATDGLFSFPHLRHADNEKPKDVIPKLMMLLGNGEVNLAGEKFFNEAVVALGSISESIKADRIPNTGGPIINRFMSTLIYRNKYLWYKDAEPLIPLLETILESSDHLLFFSISFEDNATRLMTYGVVTRFQSILKNYISVLKTAVKYKLDIDMNY